jgi:Ca-activated chloride channel family protein
MLKLEELVRRSGVSARTVRYYVQRGLLPAPQFRGRDTTYTEEHLVRLQAIRKLQQRFLPLDAIEAELGRRSAEEILKGPERVEVKQGHPYREPPVVQQHTDRWVRWEILPGLEIHLSERADAMTRSLAEELRALARIKGGSK